MEQDRTRLRTLAMAAAGLCVLFSSGCTQIPTRELTQYRDAFAQVQTTSEDVLVDFAQAIDNARQRADAGKPAPPPTLFSTELNDSGSKQPDAVEVRRTALRTIDNFNNVLVTLAEGKQVDDMRAAGDGLVQAAGQFVLAATGNAVPGLSAISSGVQTLIGLFEQARERQQFEQAVRSGGPVIDKMLAALIEDRADHITLRADEANLAQVDIMNEMVPAAADVRNLVAARSAPADDDPREDLQDELNSALQPAEAALSFRLPLELSYTPGKPAFGLQDQVLARQSIALIKGQVVKYQANVAAYRNIRDALNNYGVMLEKTRTALKLLSAALDKPPDMMTTAEDLYQIAFSVKQDITAYRAARLAAQ